jgi:hypothetical protein
MGKKESNVITVYWAHNGSAENRHKLSMLLDPPQHLWKTMPPFPKSNHKSDNYRACKSAQEFFKNTYVMNSPLTCTLNLSGPINNPNIVSFPPSSHITRVSSMENSYALDMDFSWFLFADAPLEMRITPPFLHKTAIMQGGYLTSGSFDIGRWFRHLNLSFHLWPGHNQLEFVKGEPIMYMDFVTNKKIVLRQYEAIPEIRNMALQVVDYKLWDENRPLNYLYDRFVKSKRDVVLLKMIKENLID